MTDTVPGYYEFEQHFFPFKIYFATSEAGWNQLLGEHGLSLPYPTVAARHTTLDTMDDHLAACIITMSDQSQDHTSTEVIGLLVHECQHVLQAIREAIYDPPGSGTLDHETEAYFMQKIVMWLITVYAESGRTFKDPT